MIDKRLLIIILLLAIYSIVINPLNSQSEFKKMELKNISKSIAKEKFIAKKTEEIKKAYAANQLIVKENKALFFPADTPTSTDMSKFQQIIKRIAEKNGMQIINVNWGAVVKKTGYYILPISFQIRCYPNQLEQFIKEILSSNRLVRFKTFSVSKYRKQLIINAVVVGFKI